MCTANCILFGFRALKAPDVGGRRVLEVGSRNCNGGLRVIVESFSPGEYIGVDAEAGPGVDRVCRAEAIADVFGEESFDVVISTEMLEHVRDWRSAISNMKRVCRRGGLIVLTTRSIGFPYHGYPTDFWRYEPEDIQAMFSEMEILMLERDEQDVPGVFAKVKKTPEFTEANLTGLQLYSVIDRRRVHDLDERSLRNFLDMLRIRTMLSTSFPPLFPRI